MIVADTGGILALLDRTDRHHETVRRLFEARTDAWILPWAILAEVDHLAATRLGDHVASAFLQDLGEGLWAVDDEAARDLPRAAELVDSYSELALGLVDAVVMAQAERHRADIIVTTDGRDFRPVKLDLPKPPRLVPLDPWPGE